MSRFSVTARQPEPDKERLFWEMIYRAVMMIAKAIEQHKLGK